MSDTDIRRGRPVTPEGLRIGTNVREAREALGWNQADLARYTGITPSYFSSLEAGIIKDPRAPLLYRIALALGETMESLMGVQELRRTTKANVRRRVIAEAERRTLAEAEERYSRARLAEERATAERMEAERVINDLQAREA
jgi:transcriptional regulator with XRE-family HTH domain